MSRSIWLALLIVPAFSPYVNASESRAGDQPKANIVETERAFAARFITSAGKGYAARPCGFDMNRNGIVGELADRKVGDGKTRDPDGDGVEEDILYVDSEEGNDQTGDGSTSRPFKTIQAALDAADGPDDNAEDIICIAGVFHESLVMRHGGSPRYFVSDGFQFPKNPAMIIGWDKDGDGRYPPYDPDDTAVLDGRRMLAWAIANQKKLSFIEIAHLTVKDYGYRKDDCGAFKFFRWGDGSQSHLYIHDVEMSAINKCEKDSSAKIVLNFWGGPMTHVAFVNNLVDEYSSYFCRGAPPDKAGRFRFQNNTLRMFGTPNVSFVTGWKLWGHHRGVEILDNVVDCNAAAWKPVGHVSGVGVCQGTQDWTIRGNVFIDTGVTLQPFAKGYPFDRTLNNIVIDRNVFRSTYDGWTWPRFAINVQGYTDAPAHQTVENAAITNNFFSTNVGWGGAILCRACNGGGPQPGTVTIAGNIMQGPFARSRAGIVIEAPRQEAFLQHKFIIKNNIVASASPGLNIAADYAPENFVADGNMYDAAAQFRWKEPKHWITMSFADWKAATGQDRESRVGAAEFVDAASGDLQRNDDFVLNSFEDQTEQRSWTGGRAVSSHATEGSNSFQISPDGVAVWRLDGDWSGYRHLKLDVFNPGFVIRVGFRFTDHQGQSISAFEYNVYSGHTTQHVRIDGLANDFGIGEGIDVSKITRMEVQVGRRWRHDPESDGIYIDNLRLSNGPTEPYRERDDGRIATDPPQPKPAGFLLPEFPGFEAGYHTFAIDPAGYQLLARPGTGRDGRGRALEMKPLDVDKIKIWDAVRTFPQAGVYVMELWAKGPPGARFIDHSGSKTFELSPQWKKYSNEFTIRAGGTRRFVLEAQNLQGQSVWLDDFVVYLKGGARDLAPVSQSKGEPSVVTYADGICYINGKPTFMLGFLRGDPEALQGTPFNLCAPQELLQPDMSWLDKCAEYGLWTSVNLTATLRAVAPDNVVYFAEKYRKHPALFSYYLCDEPDHASPSATSEAPVIARATQLLHKADPYHPTQALVIPWCVSNIYRYRDTADILSADRYAVQGSADNNELWTVFRANMAMKQSAVDGQVNLFTPLARGDITREENWAQAYMCVAAGAGGIMWFHFDGARPKWSDFVELGRELREIEEFLVGVALERGPTFENDVLAQFTSGKTVHKSFRQIRGIGRASSDRTALITVNITPQPAEHVKITAPFLAHATRATVMFENRTASVTDGVIMDGFAGLERHVYVVDGVPAGVEPRPAPKVGGPHVTDADADWRLEAAPSVAGRSAEQLERDRFMQTALKKVDELLDKDDKQGALKVLRDILQRYPDAQDARERIRAIR